MVLKLVVLCNGVSFFGDDLGDDPVPLELHSLALLMPSLVTGKNEPFMLAARHYIEETLICAEIVKLMPGLMAP